MPGFATKEPSLYKPKSKIRLRLGLASPQPPMPKAKHGKQASHSDDLTTTTNTTTITSTDISSTYSFHIQGVSRTNPGGGDPMAESLGASTNTFKTSSSTSRGDSRDAFSLEISPSTASVHRQFDTISYNTESPTSMAYGGLQSRTNLIDVEDELDEFSTDYTSRASASPSAQIRDLHEHLIRARQEAMRMERDHPGIARVIRAADDIFCMDDEQIHRRFEFVKEIGFGNWGSVWRCRPKHLRSSDLRIDGGELRLGRISAAGGGSGACGYVAIKLVHRQKSPITAARVRALWGEMKIIRSLRHEPHPSIIQFEAFVVTDSLAMVVMPYMSHLIPVCLPVDRAVSYFRQITSAVGYLHERGITHNDIKPANVLISYNNTPVLVDFGFATKWDLTARGCFLSTISWGTPEYLDPTRAVGAPHDERASDVWSLGVTMFELLIGRTPFEGENEKEYTTPEELMVYWQRTRSGHWLGEWEMPADLEHLLKSMICPDASYRITAMQAYHHRALQMPTPDVVITPQFVRAAASFEHDDRIPVPPVSDEARKSAQPKKKTKKREQGNKENRATTPALGESIKQHTTVPLAASKSGKAIPSPKKKSVVINKGKGLLARPENEQEKEEVTPTKTGRQAQPLRVELAPAAGTAPPRSSPSKPKTLARPASSDSLAIATADKRASTVSAASAPKNKEQAVLRTMRSLEGTRRVHRIQSKDKDVLSSISRPAPSPPRPKSLDSELEKDRRAHKEEQRRSLGIDKLMEVQEESPVKEAAAPTPRASPAKSRKTTPYGSPARPRSAINPMDVVADTRPFPAAAIPSPLEELREKILSFDKDNLERFRKISGDLMVSRPLTPGTRAGKSSIAPMYIDPESVPDMPLPHRDLTRTSSTEALGLEDRLDRFALWVRDVERIVEDARKAISEGREPPLPALKIPADLAAPSASEVVVPSAPSPARTPTQEKRFGVTPDKPLALPAHLRTASTQVEPATPPKWMTEQDAEERVKKANEEAEAKAEAARVVEVVEKPEVPQAVIKNVNKKERPTVSHVLKLFGSEKTDKASGRSNTPEPFTTVPLKSPGGGHTLRGAPSTPALRSSTMRPPKAMTRKSESNLRNFNTMPRLSSVPDSAPSPRRAVYEDMLESTPGVIRQGDGWSSTGSGRLMSKTSSMASLREKALAFLGNDGHHRDSTTLSAGTGRQIVDLASEAEGGSNRRNSRDIIGMAKRPATPGATSMLGMKAPSEKKGIFGRLKGLGRKKGMDRVDEV